LGRTGLSVKELNRVEVLGRVKAGSLPVVEAAELMGLSYRQAKRVWARYRGGGAKALRHRGCGRESNRGYGKQFRARVLGRYREQYGDFGPTLAAEHLAEEGLAMSAETLRRWLRESGQRGMRKRQPYRQRRERRAHFGELVQLDGSFHEWLEERADRGCLMHMVDDATSTAEGRFYREETIWGAAGVLRRWIEKHGVPRSLYTDWKNVYVRQATEAEKAAGEAPLTQFGRMCQALGIRIIAANSPQAKGRVERAHGTHQDRLVKKLRLAGIANYEDANRYLDEQYLAEHNRRFARQPASAVDYPPPPAHGTATGRSVLAGGGARGERRLGGELQDASLATGAAEPALRAGAQPGRGAGKPAGRTGHCLSRAPAGLQGNFRAARPRTRAAPARVPG